VRTARSILGATGEMHARAILEGKGMAYLESNWRAASGEIDLVMRDGEFVVFVEVKVRRGEYAGSAEEAITAAKAARLLATGEWYMAEHEELGERPWRVDLVAITLDSGGRVVRNRHIQGAAVSG
jgi:putative endonuclease